MIWKFCPNYTYLSRDFLSIGLIEKLTNMLFPNCTRNHTITDTNNLQYCKFYSLFFFLNLSIFNIGDFEEFDVLAWLSCQDSNSYNNQKSKQFWTLQYLSGDFEGQELIIRCRNTFWASLCFKHKFVFYTIYLTGIFLILFYLIQLCHNSMNQLLWARFT